MASTSFAARSRAVSHTSAQPPQTHTVTKASTSTNTNKGTTPNVTRSHTSSFSSDTNVLHTHRQNHTSSKLPAYRFVDLKKDRISSAQTLPDRPTSLDTQQTGAPTRTRSLKFHLPSSPNSSPDAATRSKRPASFPQVRKLSDDSAPRSESSQATGTPTKRRLTESAAREPVQGPRELLLRKTVDFAKLDDKKSRPPSSYKRPNAAPSPANTSAARAAIPPIRSFRSSGSRKGPVSDAHSRRSSEDSFGEENTDPRQRERTLQALEGRADEDFTHLAPADAEMTTTTDNDNTADIFMKIAREEPAPRASEKQPAPAEPTAIGVPPSRSSDERPRTATTNATTVSASPKQSSGTSAPQADPKISLVLPRDTQPLLLSALNKTRDLVRPEVYSAIESAANDALALTSMIGIPGQPGPISSGASTIGGYGGVTDRQLRKKADSICRSLTELCIALTDPAGQPKQLQPPAVVEKDYLATPMSNKAIVGGLTPQRRPSAVADAVVNTNTSPRAPTALEQRRQTMLASTSLPSSRYVTAPSTPLEPSTGRKSSLLLSRIRRVAAEDQEEAPQAGRRSSLLLRTRRSEVEEPEEPREGRKTSLLLRTRKTLNLEEESEPSRVPSRAITEINSLRSLPRDLGMNNMANQSPPENQMSASAVLPRRRLLPAVIATRFTTAVQSSATPNTPGRRYLERSTLQERVTPQERSSNQDRGLHQERSPLHGRSTHHERGSYLERGAHQERMSASNLAERLAEERGQQQRHLGLSQSALLNRTGSVGRRTRETGIPSLRS
ncbi:hypothetical protein N0V88_002076 [Collariella sp. IMI 366227]|nr:hypothetical protein N0V88_002076 [Collariella sp. IMI 366227]